MKPYRILYADNDPAALKIVSDYLTKLGYIVEVAEGPEDAVVKLRNSLFDLAILDLRLADNDDPNDKSGLEIAKAEARNTPKLIYTAFPSIAGAKEALLMDAHELPPAVDFLDKAVGVAGLREAIESNIAKYVDTQADLRLVWTAPNLASLSQLVTLLDPHQAITDFAEMTHELEMVFRQLFAKYEQVSIFRLVWHEAQRCCLALYAYHHDIEDQYLLTLGLREEIRREIDLFRSTISQTQSMHSPGLVAPREGLHMAAILWSIQGRKIDRMRGAGEVIRDGTEKQILTMVNGLFASVQDVWHPQGLGRRKIRPLTIPMLWEQAGVDPSQVSRATLQERFTAVAEAIFSRDLFPMHAGPTQVEIDLPGGKKEALPNPLDILFAEREFSSAAGLTTTTLGLSNEEAVLLDEEEQSWLTDYSHIAPAIAYRDFAAFETEVRFNLPEMEDIFSAIDFEEQLLKTTSLAENVSSRNVIPSHRNTLQAIVATRNNAARLVGDRMVDYYLTVLFATARKWLELPVGIRLPRSQLGSYAHLLIFMAKICRYLEQNLTAGQPSAGGSETDVQRLTLDEQQRRIWVGKAEKQLSHTEFDLLLFLYRKKGAVCRREAILKEVLNYQGGLDKSAKSLINTHINRLRNQIEPDPENPIFVLTVRNEGYRLEPGD